MESPNLRDRAATHIQRIVRGFLARLEAIRQANVVYEKIYDPRTSGYYYFNTRSCQTSWQVMIMTPCPSAQHASLVLLWPCFLLLNIREESWWRRVMVKSPDELNQNCVVVCRARCTLPPLLMISPTNAHPCWLVASLLRS